MSYVYTYVRMYVYMYVCVYATYSNIDPIFYNGLGQ